MVEIDGFPIELYTNHRVKWVDENGDKFWGTLWNFRFTPFGDLITVYKYRDYVEQIISEEQIIDVDPLIKWHPPVFSLAIERECEECNG